jgi:hypothetical protein
MDASQIIEQARRELEEERYRQRVEETKNRLRAQAGRPWWQRVFPWRIRIERIRND